MILPVFVLSVFACIFCLQTFYLHLPALADMPACTSAQDLGGLYCLSVGLVAPSQNWPQHQTNY